MTTKLPADLVNKVVFTVNRDSYLQSTIELASAIALANQTGIHGLFVEDRDLIHMASYPFAQEISLVNAQSRVLDSQQLHCSFKARSRHFRQSLVRHAEHSSLPWSFSTARGQKINIALEKSVNAEFLIIGQSEKARTQPNVSGANSVRILLLSNHNHCQHLIQVLDLVMEKFTGQSIELLVVSSLQESSRENGGQLNIQLSDHPHSSVIQLDQGSLSATLAIKNQPFEYVIASRHEAELIPKIMQQESCPVILVS